MKIIGWVGIGGEIKKDHSNRRLLLPSVAHGLFLFLIMLVNESIGKKLKDKNHPLASFIYIKELEINSPLLRSPL